jgi:hypothetical protein
MSTLQVANIYFESTGNNRIQYSGSNAYSIIAGGTNYVTVNTTNMSVNGTITSAKLVVRAVTLANTLTAADSGQIVTVSNTSSTTITVPSGLPIGFRCMVYMINTGSIVIGNAAGVSLYSRTGAFNCTTRYGALSVFVYDTNSVIVDGSLA